MVILLYVKEQQPFEACFFAEQLDRIADLLSPGCKVPHSPRFLGMQET
jgi:hypothetical protein